MFKFRNSFLGYNKDDVTSYFHLISEKHNLTKQELENEINLIKSELADLKTANAELSSLNSTLSSDNSVLNEKVSSFEAREESITKLSEGIGKLYLVAQANAQSIINSTKENVEISDIQVNRNIVAIDETQSDLLTIKEKILTASNEFAIKLGQLEDELCESKNKISENRTHISLNSEKLDSLISNVDSEVK